MKREVAEPRAFGFGKTKNFYVQKKKSILEGREYNISKFDAPRFYSIWEKIVNELIL